jgi:hypothetical protein
MQMPNPEIRSASSGRCRHCCRHTPSSSAIAILRQLVCPRLPGAAGSVSLSGGCFTKRIRIGFGRRKYLARIVMHNRRKMAASIARTSLRPGAIRRPQA